jgi:hypothetical protein
MLQTKMKIGILTFHHVDNYGATLQAVALWSFLNSQGFDVEIIDYRPYKVVLHYCKTLKPIRKRKGMKENDKIRITDIRINENAPANLRRAWRMRRFLLSNVRLSDKKVYLQQKLEYFRNKYDVVICGSDQIWCVDTFFRGFDSSFFLDFIDNNTTRKVSYAASLGNSRSFSKYQKEICNYLNQYQTILVRDSNSAQVIANECSLQATKVLDPTFLINYDQIQQSLKIQDKYILLYTQDILEPAEEDFAKLVAETYNLKIVSIGQYNRIADINITDASPGEWVGAHWQASYIMTNTFHGTVFSLISQKPFTVFVPPHKLTKIKDLLGDLGLENRLFSNQNNPQVENEDIFNIDYTSVSKILDSKILESKKYLVEAIVQEAVDIKTKVEFNRV